MPGPQGKGVFWKSTLDCKSTNKWLQEEDEWVSEQGKPGKQQHMVLHLTYEVWDLWQVTRRSAHDQQSDQQTKICYYNPTEAAVL